LRGRAAGRSMHRVKPFPPPSSQGEQAGAVDASFTLDPAELAQRRAQAEYRVHAVQIPLIRAAGFVVLCLMAAVQNAERGVGLADPALGALVVANLVYAGVSGLLLRRLHGRTGALNASLVFFHLDLVMFLVNLYHFERGGVLFFAYFLLIRVADQVGFGFRRALYFGHVVVAGYLLYSVLVAHGLRPDEPAQWGERLAIALTMYLLTFYLASTGVVMERMRRRATAAVRAARALVSELEQRNRALEDQARELEHARAAAEAASVAKSQFLAMVSHEIRTPMHGVLGANELLLATPLSTAQRRYVETAHRSGKALMALIDDVIDLSRIEGGQAMALNHGAFNLRALLEDTVALARHMLRDKPVTLQLVLPTALPAPLEGDATRLRQLLVNLLHNAIKFTDEGQVCLSVTCLADDAHAAQLRFEVTDTGIGIAADQHESVWDMFSQADTSSTRRHGGSGLGLAIVRQIVDLMGGQAGLVSEPGQGSTFWVELELAKPAGEAAVIINSAAPVDAPARRSRASTRVLLAEDNAVNQLVLGEMLEVLGCDVTVVNDGEAACRAVAQAAQRAAPYDLVFMDCHMPTLDGFAATRRIRRDEAAAGVDRPLTIVALTADALIGDRERCIDAGMDDYLTKPIGLDELARVLHERVAQD
jgi:signal transduction histidine kinase/ActR/RegA family two-component response regulator